MKVAILFQANPPPKSQNGLIKPFKPTGYRDSSADLGYQLHLALSQSKQHPLLQSFSYELITNPKFYDSNQSIAQQQELFFCFPDTEQGMQEAISLGANFFWCNTILYPGHCIEKYFTQLKGYVGNSPQKAGQFDDKSYTNKYLLAHHAQVANHILISIQGNHENSIPLESVTNQSQKWQQILTAEFRNGFPLVLKPVLGRGSQGVKICSSENDLLALLSDTSEMNTYLNTFGEFLMLEEYLPGEEITVTVFPPGNYYIHNQLVTKSTHWALAPVIRTQHINGIAPYNGTVPVVQNSKVFSEEQFTLDSVKKVMKECEIAAKIINCTSVCRIDCRMTNDSVFKLFDMNLKPNITGAGREGREVQDSLVNIAASSIGWTYQDVVLHMLYNSVKLS